MNRKTAGIYLLQALVILVVLSASFQARAQDHKAPYPSMAPLDQYLMADWSAEVALARSAAPDAISRDATVMVLGRHGYETAFKGKNGFVCIVERSWNVQRNDPEFWNPKMRAPICFNAQGARSQLPLVYKKTEWVLAGQSKDQIFESLRAALDKKEFPALEPGAMCYMMSKQGYLNNRDGHWMPHLMFFVPPTDDMAWGANLPGSPVLALQDAADRLTIFLIPVGRWSDGTAFVSQPMR